MAKKEKIIFFSLLGIALILLFFRLGRADMLSDDGHYAFRALGYYDYLNSTNQTTPVQWFGFRPGWSFLGFHDHPLLFFLLEFIMLKIFGATVTATRILPALAALGAVAAIYFLARRVAGRRAAVFSATALILNTYFVWTGRLGLLESLFTFWLVLGLLYLVKALQEGGKYFIWAGLFLGLSFLSKYTFLFAVPAILIFLLWQHRQVFKNKKFWLGILVFLVIAAPIVIYNLEMYAHRGHFDVQFSDFFHQQHKDWTLLSNRIVTAGFHPLEVLNVLRSGFSWPYFVLFVISFFGSIYLAKKSRNRFLYLPLLVFFCFWAFFSWLGAAARWLGVTAPFVALAIGAFVDSLLARVRSLRVIKALIVGILGLVGVFALFYNLNTNHFLRAVGNGFWYADFRVEDYGYNQLDKKVSSIVFGKHSGPVIKQVVDNLWFGDVKPEALPPVSSPSGSAGFNSLIVYDINTQWFATVWIFDRWRFYHRIMALNSQDYLQIVNDPQALSVLRSLNIPEIYLIVSSPLVAQQSRVNFAGTDSLVNLFKNQGVAPETIYDDKGQAAFYIYHDSFR